MKKSVSKKIKITGSGKILRWPMAKGHNRSRKTSSLIRHKRKMISITGINVKLLKNYLHSM